MLEVLFPAQWKLLINITYCLCFSGSGVSCGKIIQRFPAKDWSDCPFTEAIELVRVISLFLLMPL